MLIYSRHADVRLTELDGEGVVLHLGTRKYYSLNGTGLALMQALERGRTEEDLVTALTGEFDVTEVEARRDVAEFLREMGHYGMIETEER